MLTSQRSIRIPSTWRLVPIGEVLIETQYGTNAPAVTGGNTKVVGMKNIQNGRVLTDNRTNSYDLVGKVGIFNSDEKIAFASYLVRLVADRTLVSPEYLNYWLNSYSAQTTIKRIATRAISQANINPTEFKKNSLLPLPPLPEQTTIANLLSTWDTAIEITEKLITTKQEQRKGLMQQLLSGKQRFPGFTKLWQEVRLSDVFKRVTRKNSADVTHVLTASGKHGLIDQKDYFNRSVSGKSLEGYYHLKQGEFAYNRSAMKGYPYGAIKRLDDYTEGVLSTLYLCFKLSSRDQNSDFFMHYFEAGNLNRQLRRIAQVGARAHGLLNVTAGDFFNLRLQLPELDEQKSVACFLNNCDLEISLLQKKLNAFREQKRGLMQKLLTGKWRVCGGGCKGEKFFAPTDTPTTNESTDNPVEPPSAKQ